MEYERNAEIPIPFSRPLRLGIEERRMREILATGPTAGGGELSECCRRLLEKHLHGKVLLTPSCTAALEMAAMLCHVGPGDEVVLPSLTFVSTANAFVRAGARPSFVDVRRDTFNIDESLLEGALSERTRAIVVVHYGGVACEMDRISGIARRHGVPVVEDAAHALGASYRGRPLGSLGDLGCFSFHESKNIQCGQGGALCVNRPELVERAEVIRDRGTDRQRFFRGEVPAYQWVDIGSSYQMSEIHAAWLWAQLPHLDEVNRQRRRVCGWYDAALATLEERGMLRRPVVPPACESSYHVYAILLEDRQTRDDLMAFLHARSIGAVIHYVPLHLSPFGRSLVGDVSLPVTESVAGRLLRLPLFYELTEEEVARVVGAIEEFFGK